MIRSTIFAFLTFATLSAYGFAPPLAPSRNVQMSTTARNILLSNEETDAILQSAHECAEGECSIDDVSELIYELRDQQKEMQGRLEEIMNMVSHLQEINKGDKRVTDDVRAYVKDLLRVFDSNTGGWATGFTGDIGDGPTTAYDALDPKPWKATP